jgi:LytR cell envelope-related transcriptional attenuator
MSLARLRALIIVGVLVVVAGTLVTIAIVKDRQANADSARSCGAGDVPANLRLPDQAKDIKINVLNATDSPGLARQVGDDFRGRKITVLQEGNDPVAKRVDQVAVLRYGPKSVGMAWLLQTYFLNKAKAEFDIARDNDVVDVVLGQQFKQLASTTEANQALTQMGAPRLPPGTCDASLR